jgi:hypothetical protein
MIEHKLKLTCRECNKPFDFIIEGSGFKKLSDDTMNIVTHNSNSVSSCCYCDSIVRYPFRSSINSPLAILIEVPKIIKDEDHFYAGLR